MKKTLFALLFTSSIFADSNYNMILDPHLSPYIGADDLIAAHRILETSKLNDLTLYYRFSPQPMAKLARGMELVFFWDPINCLSMTTQHEVFGHGYRVRSQRMKGAEVVDYSIGVPPPYGIGGGVTRYRWDYEHTSIFDKIAITTGGIEASTILANRVKLQWLREGQVNPWQSTLYLLSEHNLTDYVGKSRKIPGDDVNDYLEQLNFTYRPKDPLTLQSLKKQVLINLLDPFTYYAFFAWGKYIWKGKSGPLPMIPLGSYKYLPAARMGFTPFGSEYYIDNFLVKDGKPIYFYIKAGKFAGMTYTGMGIEYPHLWDIASFALGFRVDTWHQPKVDVSNPRFSVYNVVINQGITPSIKESQLGISFSIIAERKIWDSGAIFLQLGAKTNGFVPGEELTTSPIFRTGITLW